MPTIQVTGNAFSEGLEYIFLFYILHSFIVSLLLPVECACHRTQDEG
jgi:hypothetical protein